MYFSLRHAAILNTSLTHTSLLSHLMSSRAVMMSSLAVMMLSLDVMMSSLGVMMSSLDVIRALTLSLCRLVSVGVGSSGGFVGVFGPPGALVLRCQDVLQFTQRVGTELRNETVTTATLLFLLTCLSKQYI